MARATIDPKNLPDFAKPSVEHLGTFGFFNSPGAEPGWRFFENHRLADTAKRVQVRAGKDLAPVRESAHYATCMKKGDQFPPVIVTADGYLVDGATRTQAARKCGYTTFPAFVLTVRYEGAPKAMRNKLIKLGAKMNHMNGRRMSAANTIALIEAVTEGDDIRPQDLAAELSISLSTAQTAMSAIIATRRAERLGVKLDGSLTRSNLRMFGNKDKRVNDPVFAEALKLAQDARLTSPALRDLFRRIEAEGTDEGRLRVIASERAANRDMIERGVSRPSPAARLRQSLGILGNVDPEELIELSPAAAPDHRKALEQAARRLVEVIDAQTRLDLARVSGEQEVM